MDNVQQHNIFIAINVCTRIHAECGILESSSRGTHRKSKRGSNIRIGMVSSNPTRGMDVCLCLFCVCVMQRPCDELITHRRSHGLLQSVILGIDSKGSGKPQIISAQTASVSVKI
jgi:hypothetical protein